jgi:hypothetical protein
MSRKLQLLLTASRILPPLNLEQETRVITMALAMFYGRASGVYTER